MDTLVAVIGVGFVGSAMVKSFKLKGIRCVAYDKYKNLDRFEDCLNARIAFLCLPTQFDDNSGKYDTSAIAEVCQRLSQKAYQGLVVVKSTVEPETTDKLVSSFPHLQFIHNPEFLSASTAYEDFHNQKHVVIGRGSTTNEENLETLIHFYQNNYPRAEVSVCSSLESESMKCFVNCFYATKIQFFNELYLLCNKTGSDYGVVRALMIKNGWINPMHTKVPGSDGQLSYGGMCFPKDTRALLSYMKRKQVPNAVLNATVTERDEMRQDNMNVHPKKVNDCGDLYGT